MTLFHPVGQSRRPRTVPTTLNLRLLQTTDLHAHLLAYDYIADRPADRMGLTRLASLIRAARAETGNSLLMDTGDFLQGNPLGDLYAMPAMRGPARAHPVIAAMNSLGYDAATPGNHDFNYGIDFLTRTLRDAAFPVVSANVARRLGRDPSADETLLPPWTILTRRMRDAAGGWHEIRIGVIGLVPPQIEVWDRRHLQGQVRARDMVEAARAHVPLIRAAGADLVVVLSHSGIASDRDQPGMENAAVPLAAIEGVDAILCGHQHQTFPGPAFAGIEAVDVRAGTIHGKPAVMAGFWGSHLGLIDLTLRCEGEGWRIAGHRCHLRAIYCKSGGSGAGQGLPLVADDQALAGLTREAHGQVLNYVRRPVGRSSVPVHSFFALVADDPSIQLVAEAQRARVEELLRGGPDAGVPLLSAVSPFKAGGAAGPEHFTDVPAGPLRIGNLADLYVFPNLLRAVRVTGAGLADWLEHAAGQFNRIVPGQPDQMLRNMAFPSYNFDVICGLRYVIDPSQPARFAPDGRLVNPGARRVREVTWQGEPVVADQRFIVATNSFRAAGGGGFPAAREGGMEIALEVSESIRDVLTLYIARSGHIAPVARPVWRFAPAPGTSVLFDSAPAAAEALHDLSGVRIESTGATPEGFVRFRLYF